MADLETALERAIPEINFLTIATPDIMPGALLESRHVDHYIGRIEPFLVPPLTPADFETERQPAAVNLRSLSTERSGQSAIGLLQMFGLNLAGVSASTTAAISVQLQLEAVTVQKFKSGLGKLQLERALRSLKERDLGTFRLLKRHFLVLATYYARDFQLTFGRELLNAIDLDAKLRTSARAKIRRQGNTVWVAQNETLPFGVFGYEITPGRTILEAK
ncbi:MAG: hypothetical protein HC795_07315 [Coleofasciculaceae cyanobacterium RL_1_1]|nr:hypothetical protein [Coleofasciculaceae cyanobacterium RL_1_1]